MAIRTLCCLILATLWIGAAEARMYRWVDENGVTVYSQSPPVTGDAAEIKVNTAPASSAPTPPPARVAGATASDEQTRPTGPTPEEIAESDRIKAKNCEAARSNLNLYQNLGNKLVKTPEGLYKRLTEEERQEKIGESKELITEFCAP